MQDAQEKNAYKILVVRPYCYRSFGPPFNAKMLETENTFQLRNFRVTGHLKVNVLMLGYHTGFWEIGYADTNWSETDHKKVQ
jgi:hypothetical protein